MVKVYVEYESKLGLKGSFFCSKKKFKEEWKFFGKYWKWCVVRINDKERYFWSRSKLLNGKEWIKMGCD